MKQDYQNFKKYINAQFYPSHTDYLYNDCAPDLLRFMSIKIGGRKTGCYYNFLKGIEEENLPDFTDHQVALLKYASSLLPLVRPYEFIILRALAEGQTERARLAETCSAEIENFSEDALDHALHFLCEDKQLIQHVDEYVLAAEMDDQFREHLEDLLEYGLSRYRSEYNDETDFLLWQSYSMDAVQRKLLKNPGYTQLGTYVYGKEVVIFASLKKDASVEERLQYKDKFLTDTLFQWECENNIRPDKLRGLNESDFAYVFVRKVSEEHGIVLPFTYVGKGKLTNPRIQNKPEGTTYLYDILMENPLPDYLQYDFGLQSS